MKKSVALLVVWAVVIMVTLLALGAGYLMGNQGMVTEKKITRMRAYYTAKAGMVHALEQLRRGLPIVDGELNDLTFHIDIEPPIEDPNDPFAGCRLVRVTVSN